ncbi:FHA domain-containing protein [Dolichospermum sp. ST_sed1]|nr:FHA domain-containing protein [Dolichospermum sp. ST_sed1]MDD1436074.1 FHA domain-containing protein [Dolichospermum sp. ST_sed10]MDD1454570.1 FHA domain-containing protein [Dolichospermum sp. ST_sed7]
MIVCPNCNHPNPDGAVQCEACYTPLPATANCPNCGATVQSDAAFCGQCGYNLHYNATPAVAPTIALNPVQPVPVVAPDLMMQLLQPDVLEIAPVANPPAPVAVVQEQAVYVPSVPAPVAPEPEIYIPPVLTPAPVAPEPEPEAYIPPAYVPQIDPIAIPEAAPAAPQGKVANTQLQQVVARLFHVQANQEIELPQNLSVVHIGKPNDRIPPDIDVSGFPNSEIVSRIHADIRIEGDACYLEDGGSSNGTYVNNLPLLPGNRHRLRPGDRISLGKGDLVTFLFQLS